LGDKEHAVDEQRHPEGDTGYADGSAWRSNGAHGPAEATALAPGGRSAERPWSSAGAALEPSAEPLALLTNHAGQANSGAGREARHRRPGSPADIRFGASAAPPQQPRSDLPASPYGSAVPPGPDDDTPAGGLPVVEPPLWREAARYSAPPRYDPTYSQYPPPAPPAPAAPPAGAPVAEQPPPPEPPQRPEPPRQVQPQRPAEPPPRRPEPQRPAQTGLPQRVPAEPDVPVSQDTEAGARQEQPGSRDRWTAPELAWIADQLRRDDVPRERPPETFDVDAVVAAVGEVPGVRAASVRTNPSGVHTLRLDLADDADPGEVSRTVARLLLERMGLSAAPQHVPQARTSQEAVPPVTEPDISEIEDLGDPLVAEELLAEPPLAEPAPVEPAPVEPLLAEPAPVDETLFEPPLAPVDEPLLQPEDEPPLELEDEPLLEEQPEPMSRPLVTGQSAPRVVINQVQVSTVGLEATVEVRLTAGDRQATGVASGPAVDSYLVRLAAVAASKAIDELLRAVVEPGGPSRCFVEHTGVMSFGNTDVAVAVVLLVCGGWVEQLTGSALVDGDPRQAVVRATLGAVNRRLEALLD
jgi:hypothetical protein